MDKLSQKGFAHIVVILILLAGLAAALYLVQNRTNILPKAGGGGPPIPQTSFSLIPMKLNYNVGDEVAVNLSFRSDIAASNLFSAKISYDKDLLEFKSVEEGTFIKNWVEKYTSEPGKISLVGGIPNPGYKTELGYGSPVMATFYLKALKAGTATISFDDTSAIYSNADNANILVGKEPVSIVIGSQMSSPQPSASATPTPSPSPSVLPASTAYSRVFVTSATYNGNLGGLDGADAKCQARADAANLGGIWKAWLSNDTTSAAGRLSHNSEPYKLVNGTTVANNWADLTDGSLKAAINFSEIGTTVNAPWVWTNSFADGSRRQNSGTSCLNWNGTSSGGTTGDSTRNDSGWSDYGGSGCNYSRPLYCFEQIKTTATSSPTPAPTPVPTASPIPATGDGNNDGKVDLQDLSILFSDFNKRLKLGAGRDDNDGKYQRDIDFREAIDMNGDGGINSYDYSLMRNLLIEKNVIRRS